jgi:8-oxo-dGTP diphosphatase
MSAKGTTNIPEVSVLIRSNDGKLLFVSRQNTGYADGTFCLPAGHVEPGESFSQAAVREVFEEVGLHIKPEQLRQVFTTQRFKDTADVRVGVFFEATGWSGTPKNMEPERHGDIFWFPETELPLNSIMPFHAEALRGLTSGQTYAEIGWTE